MRVVVITGSRKWSDRWPIARVIGGTHLTRHTAANLVIHGGAKGADAIAHAVALDYEIEVLTVPARWNAIGKDKAGPARNERMLRWAFMLASQGHDVHCYAFPLSGSRGTWDCVQRMRKHGVPTTVHGESEVR
jgi:hypothetical protein